MWPATRWLGAGARRAVPTVAPRLGVVVLTVAVAAGVLPATASAHGLSGRSDLPVPSWLFGWAACLVLIVSFVGLAVLWQQPRLEQVRERELLRVPPAADMPPGRSASRSSSCSLRRPGRHPDRAVREPRADVRVRRVLGRPRAASARCSATSSGRFNPWRAVARAAAGAARRFGVSRGRVPIRSVGEPGPPPPGSSRSHGSSSCSPIATIRAYWPSSRSPTRRRSSPGCIATGSRSGPRTPIRSRCTSASSRRWPRSCAAATRSSAARRWQVSQASRSGRDRSRCCA